GITPGTSPITASAMRRTLARARDGKPLDLDEATVLLHARGEDLHTLLTYAGRTRDAGLEAAQRPGIITYSRKVFIPLTRLCRDRCGYCTFATVPHRLDHLYLEPDEVLDIARRGADLGCKEARTSAAPTRTPPSGCACSRTPAAATSRSPRAS